MSPSTFRARSFPNRASLQPFGNVGMQSHRKDRHTWCIDMRMSLTFPKDLNGRFHGLLADRKNGKVMLFNDRFGLQRIYYHEAKDAFYFAAEAKAILKVRPELRTTDPRGVGEFILCGCVLENRTLFPGIYVLPPGSAWLFRGSCWRRNPPISSRASGKNRKRSSRKNTTLVCETPL